MVLLGSEMTQPAKVLACVNIWDPPKSADNRRRAGHKKCSLPLYLLPLPLSLPRGTISDYCEGVATYHAVIRRRFTKSVHCAGLRSVCQKTLGCSIPPGSAFASLAAPAAHRQHHLLLIQAPAKDEDEGSDAGDVAHAGEGTSGNEGGKGGKGSQQAKGGKISGRKGRRSGEKMP